MSDLCPLFGCHREDYVDSSKKSKVALLEKCTSDSIERIKANCLAISTRFLNLTTFGLNRIIINLFIFNLDALIIILSHKRNLKKEFVKV